MSDLARLDLASIECLQLVERKGLSCAALGAAAPAAGRPRFAIRLGLLPRVWLVLGIEVLHDTADSRVTISLGNVDLHRRDSGLALEIGLSRREHDDVAAFEHLS